MAMMGSPASGSRSQVAVDVGEADVDGVVLTLRAGFPLRGKIYVEGQASSTPVSADLLRNVLPFLRPMGDTLFVGTTRPEISSDGSFVISQLLSGSYSVSLSGLPPDYYVKAVRFENIDVLREGLTLEGPPEASLDILVSPNAGRIEGTVMTADGPIAGVQVVMIPRDRTRADLYKFANTDQNGRFTIRGIPPGQYKLFAWEEIETNAFRDPEFLRLYEELGKAVGIVEGDRVTVDVRLIPAGNED
jgi:hypothetical protein